MEGYNFGIKIGGKLVLARTDESVQIEARIKESITKDDEGNTRRSVSGHDVTFNISNFLRVNESGSTEKLDRDDVMDMVMAVGSQAEFDIVYQATGLDSYGGKGIISSYSENHGADADNEPTGSITVQSSGAFAKITSQSNP